MKKHLIIILLLPIVFCMSCNKEKKQASLQERLFEEVILNKDMVVSYAIDHGTELTADYKGFTFILTKTDYYHGPLTAKKNGMTYQGSWSANDDYGKLTITLPDAPKELKFLSRAWRFKSKSLKIIKLAPWGAGDDIIVHMTKE
ncbi:MAG: hypothetical protein ABIN48_00215 [Ginsengibacter sp.]